MTLVDKGKKFEDHLQIINAEFTRDDVKRVMFSIPNDKTLGVDGFNSKFFKHFWEVIEEKVTNAVVDFFKTGRLLKVINVSTLTMGSKVKCSDTIADFKPIAFFFWYMSRVRTPFSQRRTLTNQGLQCFEDQDQWTDQCQLCWLN